MFIHVHTHTHTHSLTHSLTRSLASYQVLPINDSGEDPSPYSASSSFALHPIYVRPREVAEYYKDKLSDTDLEGLVGWADTGQRSV